jgi:hypothetical protein
VPKKGLFPPKDFAKATSFHLARDVHGSEQILVCDHSLFFGFVYFLRWPKAGSSVWVEFRVAPVPLYT